MPSDILANIAHAKAVMRYILPADIVAVLDWNKMVPQKDTFITPAGRELRADALFKLPFKEAGKGDYVYLLLEHKSTQPSGINNQLKNYVDQISYQTSNKQQAPHLVIPIVFYHGRARWKRPSRLSDTFPLPEKYLKMFMRFIPQTEVQDYLLFDAFATELAELPSPLPKKLPLALIGHIYHHVFQKIWQSSDEIGKNFSFLAQLSTICESLRREDSANPSVLAPKLSFRRLYGDMAEKIVYYLCNHHKMAKDDILNIVNPAGKENAMLTYTEMKEQMRQEGIQEGMQEGVQKGIQKGMQKGRQEGIEEGMQRGWQGGASEALHHLAQNMLTEGLAVETIMRVTGLSEQEVQALR